MSKMRDIAEQVVRLWEENEEREERIQKLENALKFSAENILDWTTKYVKPYTVEWDEGQRAREYMQHVSEFKERM